LARRELWQRQVRFYALAFQHLDDGVKIRGRFRRADEPRMFSQRSVVGRVFAKSS
jgi:hypothetical protein